MRQTAARAGPPAGGARRNRLVGKVDARAVRQENDAGNHLQLPFLAGHAFEHISGADGKTLWETVETGHVTLLIGALAPPALQSAPPSIPRYRGGIRGRFAAASRQYPGTC